MNNNKLYLKILLFLLGIEVIIVGLSFKNLSVFILGVLNTVIILFMFFDIKFDFIKNRILGYVDKLNDKITKKANIGKIKKLDFNLLDFKYLLEPIKYFYLKGGFVLSVVIICLAVLDNIIFHKFNLSIFWSIVFFLTGLLLLYKNILDGEIYIGNRIVSSKDIILILSLTIVLVAYTLLNLFYFYERVFYSLFSGLLFYIVAVFFLEYTNSKLKLFKSIFMYVYLGLTMFSFFIYLYNKVPSIKKYFIIEKIVYKEKPIYKSQVYKKDDKNDKELNSKIHIAPNGKIYEIFKTSTGVYFTGYNNTRKYFSGYNEAILLIDKVNKKTSSLSGNINDMIPYLLNNDKDSLSGTVNLQTGNNILTYNDIIPEIISKYGLTIKNKPDVVFKYISKDNPNYNLFKIAYYYKMFGKNTNPNLKVKCKHFAVLLGLAKGWNVSYNTNNVFDSFYKKAIQNGYKFDICCKNKSDYLDFYKKTCILK